MKNKGAKELIEEAYDTEFKMRDKIGIDSNNTFGIEVEFENVKLDSVKYNKKWDVKIDDSVTTFDGDIKMGGEVSSPILKDNEQSWEDINRLCTYLSKKGAIATNKTGGHIHIGSQVLKDNPDNIRKFLKQWECFENVIYFFASGKDSSLRPSVRVQAEGISKKLCRIRNNKYSYNKYKTYYDWHKFFLNYGFGKFKGLNFSNYRGYELDENNTIEIRCPNGTIDPVVWQNNVNFFVKFIENCTSDNFDEEYIDYLLKQKKPEEYDVNTINLVDIDEAIELSDLIFEKRIDKIMFLKQYLKLFKKEKQYVKK